jgi:acyl-CoA synthetase (NDP forming)
MKEQLKQTEDIILRAIDDNRDSLYEHEVYEILSIFGLDAPAFFWMKSIEAAPNIDLKSLRSARIVAKVVSPDILHKTDAGGVLFIEPTMEHIEYAYRTIKENVTNSRPKARFEGVLLSEMVEYTPKFTNELIASFKQDRSFGCLLTFGQGGVHTEFFAKHMKEARSVATRSSIGLDDNEIHNMINQVAISPYFYGKMRGDKEAPVDVTRIEQVIRVLKDIGDHFSPINPDSKVTLEEFELNPVLITRDKRLIAVDGLVKFSRKKHKQYTKPTKKIHNLLKPKSAVVLGASASKMNPGRIILRNLINGGGVSKDNTYVIHNKADEIDGCQCIRAIQDIPQQVDIAVVTIPADRGAPEAVIELIKHKKTHTIILITSGFGETEAGKEKEKTMIEQILASRADEDGGVLVNGGNCLGIVSLPGKYNTFFLPTYKLPFSDANTRNVAAVSQSGAYLVTLASNFDNYINPQYTISFGNQIDVTVSDFLEYMKTDDNVEVISTYVEGFKDYDGIKYVRMAKELIDMGKVVLLYKAGRTSAGMMAAASHTASMVGDYASTLEVMKQTGVLTVDDLDTFEDYIMAFSFLSKKKVKGNRVGVISNAGFECTRAADSLYDMVLADFSSDTLEKIKSILPSDIVDIHNPIDATPTARTKHFIDSIEVMMEDDNVDCVVVSPVSPTPALENMTYIDEKGEYGEPGKVIEDINRETSLPKMLIEVFQKYDKPMVVCVDSGELFDQEVAMMKAEGIPVYRKIDRATRAMSAFVVYHLDK